MDSITTTPDRHLSDAEFYAGVSLSEHSEMDCEGGGEYECPTCTANRATIDAVKAEMARREAEGITIDDPNEPSFEERFAPFGPEWEREQRERMEGIA